MSNIKNMAVLVLSCDKYSSLWDVFFDRFFKYWPNCTHPIYLVSNFLQYTKDPRVQTLNIGKDVDWSSNLLLALKEVKQDHILVLIEDAPFDSKVDSEKINDIFSIFIENNMNHLNLKGSPKPNGNVNEFYGEVLSGTLYRTSLVPCLWKKEMLFKLLQPGETAWDFEIVGSVRSEHYSGFYSLNNNIFNLLHIIIKGKIERSAFKKLVATGEADKIRFPSMSMMNSFVFNLLLFRSFVFNRFFPLVFRKKIRLYLHR